jgi:hypothetical protein
MPTIVWFLIWVAVIGTIAVLAFREIRSGRKQPPEFDRNKHEAVREAGVNMEVRGPNGGSSMWG